MNRNVYLPDQTVSDNQKLKEDWYVPTYDYYIEKCISQKSNEVMDKINAANGDVSTEKLDYLLKPFNIDASELNLKYPYEAKKTDIISPIVERVMGEYIELPYNFTVKFHDPDLSTLQDMELKTIMEKIIKETLVAKLQEDEANQTQTSPEDINNLIAQKKADYIKSESLKAKRFLQYINEKLDFDYYRFQMFFNWWTTEECYVYRTIKDGEFVKTIISPQFGYPYVGDRDFVEDGLAFVHIEDISWDDFYFKYRNELDKDQLDYVEKLQGTDKLGSAISTTNVLITERQKYDWYRISDVSSVIPEITMNDRSVRKYNVIFQTYRKVKKLLYKDFITGKEATMVVPNDYKINYEWGDISVTENLISESWEGCRIGYEQSGIYIKPHKHLVQREGKIPVTGKSFILKNKKSNPVPYRLIAFQVIDMMINHHIEKTLAKYKEDILIIPRSLLTEDKAGTTKEKTFYMLKDGRIIYDDAKVELQTAVQGIRLITGSTTANYIQVLIELQQHYRNYANEIASMNNDRLGNIDTRGGVSNVEQNIYRSKLGTVLSLEVFRKILEKEHECDLEYAKYLFIDGVDDTMFDEKGNPIQIQQDGYRNFKRSYGVYIENGPKVDKKLEVIRQMAISAAQNGDMEAGIASVETDSIEEIKSVVARLDEAKKNFEREMETRKQQTTTQQIEATKEMAQISQNYAIEKLNVEGEIELDKIITTKEYDLTIADMSNQTSLENTLIDSETARLSNETRERIEKNKDAINLQREKVKAEATIQKEKLRPKPTSKSK